VTRVAVVGSSGFVGAHVSEALAGRGVEVVPVHGPRVDTAARTPEGLAMAARVEHESTITGLREKLRGVAAVINAAGVADATHGGGDTLWGANALLPMLLASASPVDARLVHISSAAVQGRRPALDETAETEPFSPYSSSKALGEAVVAGRPGTVAYRPTSVHGPGRGTTRALARLCASPVASVAGNGDRPTPQSLVENVADAIATVALTLETPPPVVLHPWEGLCVADLVRVLGGREPLAIPEGVARAIVDTGWRVGRTSARSAGLVRRLEMLWFGQAQAPGWLDSRWSPPHGVEYWGRLRP